MHLSRLLPVVIFAVALAEQETAQLHILVPSASAPVAGATVRINELRLQTGPDGSVSVDLPLGKVTVEVSRQGYLKTSASVEIDQPRQWRLSIELVPLEPLREEITVSATRTDRLIQDLPTRVEVLGREEIEEKMLMTPGDIVMLLNEMGGMSVQTTSPGLGAASIRIQGMPGRYTRFLSDGLPLFGQQGAGLGILQIPPMDLGQVEVVKGVSSALYGAGAMAGIVNLISRRAGPKPSYELLLNRSTRGATDLPFFFASPLKRGWTMTLLAGGHRQQYHDADRDGWADLARYARGILRPRLFWDGGNGRSASLTAGVTTENREGGTLPGAVLPATGSPYLEALRTRRWDLGGLVQTLVGPRVLITARWAGSSQHHRHQFGDIRERDRHNLFLGEWSARASAGKQTWVAGFAHERVTYKPYDLPGFAYKDSTPGIFAQDDIDLASWLSISASFRADFHNRYGAFVSPRLAALLRGGDWTSRFSLGEGFLPPGPLTEETESAGLTRLVIPAPLRPERGRSFSLDVTRHLRSASFTATSFAYHIRHPLEVRAGDRYELVNLPGPTRTAGLEFTATWRKTPLAAVASYTYIRWRKFEDGTRTDVPRTPRHSLGLTAVWEHDKISRLGFECYYTGRQRLENNPYRDTSRPYVVLGLMTEVPLGPFRIFFNAENFTDVRQTRWDPLLRPARAADGRWTVDAWAPLEGRVFNGGIRLKF